MRDAARTSGSLEPLELEVDRTNPKSRWCVGGREDPEISQIERSSPTPQSASINASLQLCSSRRWATYPRDVKTAFLQSKPTTRKVPLACEQPSDETLPGLGHCLMQCMYKVEKAGIHIEMYRCVRCICICIYRVLLRGSHPSNQSISRVFPASSHPEVTCLLCVFFGVCLKTDCKGV